ncbi:Protein of unknown function [Tistlia consotensis]|uniref:VWFA domain-containing protein n=1 Tax=Tistlia consotensis USBA 355 TaxID=560819 RepID=A0A1Y6BMX5_9PROT|nr:DUF1194 domain-containing protein [Tistlia consotensis]SMF20542.1 Protein of unknown function [Tistlia consotensis USBA 355]SNR47808.1 Protein of unknown function [Tistlia consotensis]
MSKVRLLLLLVAIALGLPGSARAATAVDLELVLAVDASSSVTSWEFDLQMQGLSDAFRDPAVQGAIRAAGDLGIAVTLVQWSGRDRQIKAVEWTLVYDAASADEFAADIDAAPRFVTGGSTAIGNAIGFSHQLILSNAYQGARKAIDVSGDGRTNQGVQTPVLRDAAIADGITVNGLTILNEDPSVDTYYRDNVIGGSGAFLITATDYRDFARAIKLKLIREIGGPPLVMAPPERSGQGPGEQTAGRY